MRLPDRDLDDVDPRTQPDDGSPRPITHGAVLSAAGRIWLTAAGGITTIVIARVLGPSGWAAYSIAQSLTVLLLAATAFGVDQGIVYFVSSGKWSPRAAFRTAVRVAGIAGCLGGLIAVVVRLVATSAFAGLPLWLTAAAVASVPFSLLTIHASFVAVAIDRYEDAVLLPSAQAALVLLFAIPAAIAFGRTGAVTATSGAAALVGIGAIVWARTRLTPEQHVIAPRMRTVLSFGLQGYSANALQLVNLQIDLFILSAVASNAAVGHYALAASIATLLLLLPGALSAVLLPRVAKLSSSGEASTREMVETKSLRHATLLVAVGAVAIAAGFELLLKPVFGADYRAATNLGLILLPGAAALGLSSVLAATLIGRGKPVYSLYGALVTTPLTLAMYVTLIPWLHANGAAIASTVSYIATFLLFCHFYRRATGRKVLPLLAPTRSEISDLRELAAVFAGRIAGNR